jgi:hypothetical protein
MVIAPARKSPSGYEHHLWHISCKIKEIKAGFVADPVLNFAK